MNRSLATIGGLVAASLLAACAPGAEPSLPAPATGETVELVLLGTTDVHGRLLPHDYYRDEATDHGLALIAPLIDSVRAANPGRVLLFDSGDLLQGNPLAYVAARVDSAAAMRLARGADAGNPVVRAMNMLDYDAAAIGNHEFNYGIPYLRNAVEQADFPFVSANIFVDGSDERAFRDSALLPHVTAAGDTVLVGVTGATPPGVEVWDRANVQGRLDFHDIVASVRPVVADLRARGADLVVVLSHGGFEGTSYDAAATGLPPENAAAAMAREVPGIDVILMGHTHREVADTTINGVAIAQARNWARSLAAMTVRLERTGRGEFRRAGHQGVILRPAEGRTDAEFAAALDDWHERTLAYVGSVVGRSTAAMPATRARVEDVGLIDFINDVQRRAAGADLASSAAFNLDAGFPAGPVTIADVANVYVYDNTLKAIRVTGAQLRAYLEKTAEYYRGWPVGAGETATNPDMPGYNFDIVSGVEYTIDVSRPVGQRITTLTYQGQPVRDDQTFTLALNNYRQTGGGGYTMLADAPVVYDEQREIRDLLIEEFRTRGTIDPADYFQPSWRLVPEAAAARALAEQTGSAAAAAGRELSAGAAGTADSTAFPAAPIEASERLRVLTLNDLHGRLLPDTFSWSRGRPVGGAVALASHFAAQAAAFAGPTAIIDGGDVYQGTPISNLTDGRSSVAFYNLIGLDASAIGNHEFDWGVATMRQRLADAEFAWLAANIRVEGADTAPPWAEPVAMLDIGGVRVGVIGLATEETPNVTRAVNVRGLRFLPGAGSIDRWVPELRRRGADFVIVTAHAGAICDRDGADCEGEIVDVARAVRHRPDLIVGGHTHRVVNTVVNGIPIIESGSYGTRYGVVDLFRVSPDSVAVHVHGFPTTWGDVLSPDPAATQLVERFRGEVGPAVDRVVTRLAEPLEREGEEYALGRLIADAQRWATHAQVALMNNGGIRTGLPAGPVTWSQLFQLQPFENRLVRMQLPGADLRAAIERDIDEEGPDLHVSGVRIWYDPRAAAGERVVALELDSGEPVRDDEIYTVTVNDFMAYRYEDESMAAQALAVEETPIVDLDALVDYLDQLPQPVRAPAQPRIQAASPMRTGR